MKKNFRSVLSFMLALIMIVSLPMAAFAEDVTVVDPPVDNGDGTSTVVTTTTTTSKDAEGNTTVTVTIEKATDGTLADGTVVDRDEMRSDTTVEDKDGFVLGESFTESGSDIRRNSEEIKAGEDLPDVTVALTPGTPSSNSVQEKVNVSYSGDLPNGEDDNNYKYSESGTIIDRTVTANTSEVKGVIDQSTSDMAPVGPDNYEGKQDLYNYGGNKDKYYDENIIKDPSQFHIVDDGKEHDGYDYQYVGYSEYNINGVSGAKVVYKRDGSTGEILTDEAGQPVIDHFEDFLGKVIADKDGTPITDPEVVRDMHYPVTAWAVQFLLQSGTEEDFQNAFGYCIDMEYNPVEGKWYSIANLEDSDYYPDEESEAHIRGIVSNGYWGSSNEPNADGSYKAGSVAKIKADLLSAIENGEIDNTVIETITNADGSSTTVYLSDVISGLTEGEAMKATQAAIWSYSNGSTEVLRSDDGYIVLDPAHYEKTAGERARVTALYNWLLKQTVKNSVTVINEKNFVENLTLTVGDKSADVDANNDADQNNDVYDSSINFTLAFVPDPNSDDLLIYLTDANGNTINDADGNPIVKRLAGENSEGREADTILPDDNGVYTITGLQLSENQDFTFDLKLEGTQYLEKGVYLYTAHGGRESSQTMVSYAEGTRNVDVSLGVTISFNVDESKTVYVEQKWHNEGDPNYIPPAPPAPPVPLMDEPEEDIIEEEPVPLAQAPSTGGISTIFAVAAAVSGMGLAGLAISTKRKDEE